MGVAVNTTFGNIQVDNRVDSSALLLWGGTWDEYALPVANYYLSNFT